MRQVAEPFTPPPGHAPVATFSTADDLAAIRQFACERALAASLLPQRVAALEVAVSEVATNTLRHTEGGHGTIRVWADTDYVICEITDSGTFSLRRRPADQQAGGWGLDIATDLADEFYLHSQPGCSVFRLLFRL